MKIENVCFILISDLLSVSGTLLDKIEESGGSSHAQVGTIF